MELPAKSRVLRDDIQSQGAAEPVDDELQAQKKLKRRLVSMAVFMVLLAIPVAIAAWRFWQIHSDVKRAEAAAEAELASAQPRPQAYAVLGSIRLDQGRLAEALPLLEKAAAFEAAAGRDTHDTLTLAKARILAAKRGLPGADAKSAAQALEQSLALADKQAQGKRAATYFSAGLFFKELGERERAVKALEKAVELQPDDWVLGPDGKKFKSSGISGYYRKMLIAAQMD